MLPEKWVICRKMLYNTATDKATNSSVAPQKTELTHLILKAVDPDAVR